MSGEREFTPEPSKEEQIDQLIKTINECQFSQEAKDALSSSLSSIPDLALYLEALKLGKLIFFEDTDRNDNKRAVMVDTIHMLGHWVLFDGSGKEEENIATDMPLRKEENTRGDLAEREILEVMQSYQEAAVNLFSPYRERKLDEQTHNPGETLHYN